MILEEVKYFLEYKFPIEQLLSQNKFIWITKMYFIVESIDRKNFSQGKQPLQNKFPVVWEFLGIPRNS